MNRADRRKERFSFRKKGDLNRKSIHKFKTNVGMRIGRIARGEE